MRTTIAKTALNSGYSFIDHMRGEDVIIVDDVHRRVTTQVRTPVRAIGRLELTTPRPASTPKVVLNVNSGTGFALAVERHLRAIGGVKPQKDHSWCPWTLETRAGTLLVLVYGTRVMCRFMDVEKAASLLGVGPKSRLQADGAWNFIFGDSVTTAHAKVFMLEIASVRRNTNPGVATPSSGSIVPPPVAAPSVPPPSNRKHTAYGIPLPAPISSGPRSAPVSVSPISRPSQS